MSSERVRITIQTGNVMRENQNVQTTTSFNNWNGDFEEHSNIRSPPEYHQQRRSLYQVIQDRNRRRDLYNNLALFRLCFPDGYEDILNSVINNSEDDTIHIRNDNVTIDVECRQCDNEEVGTKCTICQSDFEIGDEITTLDECPHTFHNDCIMEWGKYNQICPTCRKEIPII